ncbi:MAG: ribonuclease E/G [Thiolinea sp.]
MSATTNLEETIFRNMEAAQAIARQLRLRNLGGIIILDFIDMNQTDHKQQVMKTLEQALEKDYAKTYICDVSPLGLVEMTRKRTREPGTCVVRSPARPARGAVMSKPPKRSAMRFSGGILRAVRQFDAKGLPVWPPRK